MIIDTDASFDVDDVVAVCMAHALMDRGEVDIKAIVHDAGIPEGLKFISLESIKRVFTMKVSEPCQC